MLKLHSALIRTNDHTVRVQHDVAVHIFANPEVQIENNAVDELLGFLKVHREGPGCLERVIVTPDFHKGKGIPIGTVADIRGAVFPQAIGTDIGCGVGVIVTDLQAKELDPVWPELKAKLRYLFFEGGRDILMSPEQREAMLIGGPRALNHYRRDHQSAPTTGIWRYHDPDVDPIGFDAAVCSSVDPGFADFIKGSGGPVNRDAQTGSLGGGNHFAEIQTVKEIHDGESVYQWGHGWGLLPGTVVIMIHTGSVSLGHQVGQQFVGVARKTWPKGIPKPASGFYPLEHGTKEQGRYMETHGNAVNFAACNRMFLGLMVVRALTETLGKKFQYRQVWDAPHNFISSVRMGIWRHRKGACPAEDQSLVLIPGSMGAASYVLKGRGNVSALQSACHGAGRQSSRGGAGKKTVPSELRIVTPLDPEALGVKQRQDILKRYWQKLAEEAPAAYKPVVPVIDTVEAAGIADRVARVWPLLTVKG